MTQLLIEQKLIALHASAVFARLDALRTCWLGMVSSEEVHNADRDLLRALTLSFMQCQDESLVYLQRLNDLIADNPEAFHQVDQVLSGAETSDNDTVTPARTEWRSISQNRGGIANLASEQLTKLAEEISNDKLLAQEFLDGLTAGDIRIISTPRGAGFACGFMIGATIGLAAGGGPVGIMLAVDMGGLAIFTCFS